MIQKTPTKSSLLKHGNHGLFKNMIKQRLQTSSSLKTTPTVVQESSSLNYGNHELFKNMVKKIRQNSLCCGQMFNIDQQRLSVSLTNNSNKIHITPHRVKQSKNKNTKCMCVGIQLSKTINIRSKTHKRLRRILFNPTKQDANFLGNPFFQSYVQYKNKQITYLLPAGFLRKEEGIEYKPKLINYSVIKLFASDHRSTNKSYQTAEIKTGKLLQFVTKKPVSSYKAS